MNMRIKRALRVALPIVVLLALAMGIVKYVNGREVLSALQQFDYRYIIPILLVSALSLVVIAQRFVVLLQALLPIRWQLPFKSYIASQPGLLIPGGLALRAGLLKQAGIPIGQGSVPVLLSSLLDQAMFFVISLIAALWYPPARTPILLILALLGLCCVLFALRAVRMGLRHGARWLINQFQIRAQWQQFKGDLPLTLTRQILRPTIGLTIISLAMNVIVLGLIARATGQSMPYHALLLAFVLPTMMGRMVPLLPGGIGVTEASMVGILMSVAAINATAATAVVLIFRLATIFFHALLGAIIYFLLWRGRREQSYAESSA